MVAGAPRVAEDSLQNPCLENGGTRRYRLTAPGSAGAVARNISDEVRIGSMPSTHGQLDRGRHEIEEIRPGRVTADILQPDQQVNRFVFEELRFADTGRQE